MRDGPRINLGPTTASTFATSPMLCSRNVPRETTDALSALTSVNMKIHGQFAALHTPCHEGLLPSQDQLGKILLKRIYLHVYTVIYSKIYEIHSQRITNKLLIPTVFDTLSG